MKVPSFLRIFGQRWFRNHSAESRRERGRLARQRRETRPHLDTLEDRTLLSILPAPRVLDRFRTGAGGGVHDSNPVMAISPLDPLKIVMVSVLNDPPGPQTIGLAGRFTSNGGLTWSAFVDPIPGNFVDPLRPPTTVFEEGRDPGVAFDRSNNFYVVSAQRRPDDAGGAIVLHRYNFSGATPVLEAFPGKTISSKKLYEWSDAAPAADRSDPAFNPVIAVDSTLPGFVDPETQWVQSSPYSARGQIYVAWNTRNMLPSNGTLYGPTCGATGLNPNVIKIVASSDGGANFTTQQFVNGGENCDATGYRHTLPSLTISQGRASDPQLPPTAGRGQLNVAWTRINPGNQADNSIRFNRIRDGGTGYTFEYAPVPELILDACPPPKGSPDSIPRFTDFPITLKVPAGFSANDLDITVALWHPNMEGVQLQLVRGAGEDGSGCGSTPTVAPYMADLVANRIMANGMPRPPLPGGPPQPGIAASSLGILRDLPTGPIAVVGTTFNDQAMRRINDPTADGSRRLSHFRPESTTATLFPTPGVELTAEAINNTPWTLRIWDHQNNGMIPANVYPRLYAWSITFSGQLTRNLATDVTAGPSVMFVDVANTLVMAKGPWQTTAQLATIPVHPDRGIAPNAVLASDNTLGSFSPYQGRLYMAYTTYTSTAAAIQHARANITLRASDDFGTSWFEVNNPVNDDTPAIDGFSEGTRTQFGPEIAVENSTGQLVLSWFDSRHDAARSRAARYVAASVDGGLSFSPQVFANAVNSPVDAITRQATNLGPIPDNQSPGNPNRNQLFGYGDRQGMVVSEGRIFMAWAGNENLDLGSRTDLLVARLGMPVGPRIVESTMGPIRRTALNNEYTAMQLDNSAPLFYNNVIDPVTQIRRFSGFTVTFDRFVDPATFTLADIRVFFRSPTTPIGQAAESIPVLGVIPVFDERLAAEDPDRFGMAPPPPPTNPPQRNWCWSIVGIAPAGTPCGAKKFLVLVEPQIRAGTYSYAIGPAIRDRLRGSGFVVSDPKKEPTEYAFDGVTRRVPPVGTGGRGTPDDITLSPSVNVAVGAGQVISKILVRIDRLTHSYVSDLEITLISPAPNSQRVLLSRRNGGGGGPGYIGVTFEDGAESIVNWRPSFPPQTWGPQGALNSLLTQDPNGVWTLEINDVNPVDTGFIQGWTLLIATGTLEGTFREGNYMDQDADGVRCRSGIADCTEEQLITRNIADAYSNPRPLNGVPFQAPYDNDTLPIIIPGPFLFSNNIPGRPQTLDNLVTDATARALDVVFDRNMDPNSFTTQQILRMQSSLATITGPFTITRIDGRTFRITFPEQRLSGIYTFTLGAGIRDIIGNLMDSDADAGLNTLRGFDPEGTLQRQTYNSTAAAGPLDPGKTVSMPLTVPNQPPDTFLIQGVTVRINVSYPANQMRSPNCGEDPEGDPAGASCLTATLIHPDGTRVLLFDRLRQGLDGQDAFPNTTFDDTINLPQTTSITLAPAPFNGTYIPQLPLSLLKNKLANGTWRLEIRNKNETPIPGSQINNWTINLLKQVTGTGLGEESADISYAWFRLWTWDGRNPVSRTQFQPLGPGSTIDNDGVTLRSGRIGAIEVDPSDPSGNTVYVAGASGGLWRTNNFLTQSPVGPTYVPLTDFGPALGINVGSLGIAGRNNDPRQSILFLGTGEGDTLGVPNNQMGVNGPGNVINRSTNLGVGLIRSVDGGNNWLLLDSTVNFDDNRNPLPIDRVCTVFAAPCRDQKFVGHSVFKVLVDPRPNPDGEAVVYAAISGGPNAGIWRSTDSGRKWGVLSNPIDPNSPRVANKTGEATDIVFDLNSAVIDANGRPGNIQVLYAAIRGEGVFTSPDFGTVWNILPGGRGNPLLLELQTGEGLPVAPPAAPVSGTANAPNGANGRIVLAKPGLTGSPVQDLLYQGWLYAAAIGPGGNLAGLYLTKDRGFNWTRIRHTILPPGSPSNDGNLGDIANATATGAITGNNFNVSFAIDPNDPNVIYYGGANVIRVDTTGISDPHAFYYATDRNDGGLYSCDGAGNSPLTQAVVGGAGGCLGPRIGAQYAPYPTPFLNFIRNPNNPLGSPQVVLDRATRWSNTGQGTKWVGMNAAMIPPLPPTEAPFNHHRVVTLRDQATGRTRLIFGTDSGVYTGVDSGNGQYMRSIGAVPSTTVLPVAGAERNVNVVFGSRNGNLEIHQMYAGAGHPSLAAAQIRSLVQGMFYSATQNTGRTTSRVNILQPGHPDYGVTRWQAPAGGYSQDVAVDQQGRGPLYESLWRATGGFNFFQVNRTGQGQGLFEIDAGGDAQWLPRPGFRFAINPIFSQQMIISSSAGRIFRTFNQGLNWDVIGNPENLDNSNAQALAYGAPRPGDPTSAANNFIYAGTVGGSIFVTFTGGGGQRNQWLPLSAGLDGSPVERIITNPNRGSNEAYAVTKRGVYHMPNSGVQGASWRLITGNLFQRPPVGPNEHRYFQSTDPTQIGGRTLPDGLTSIVADWRYVLPDNRNNPPTADPALTHPILYVGGEAGVYRSVDDGVTWTAFPDVAFDGAPREGGFLPVVRVTDMDLIAGEINQTDGFPEMARSGTDMLYVSTFGRSSFGIRLAPMIFPETVGLSPTLPVDPNDPTLFGSDRGISRTDRITNVTRPVFEGLTEASQARAGGNRVRIFLCDVTNPANRCEDQATRRLIGTAEADEFGRFVVQVNDNIYRNDGSTNGEKILAIYAEDSADVRGNVIDGRDPRFPNLRFTLQTGTTPPPSVPDLIDAADSGFSNTDNYTNIRTPTFVGRGEAGKAVRIFANGQLRGESLVDAQGFYRVVINDPRFGGQLADGTYTITAQQFDLAGNLSAFTAPMQPQLVIDNVAPVIPTDAQGRQFRLDPASDSGRSNTDNITNVNRPTFIQIKDLPVEPLARVTLLIDNAVAGVATVSPVGNFAVQPNAALSDGAHTVILQLVDLAGNLGPLSRPLQAPLFIDTVAPRIPSVPQLSPGSRSGQGNTTRVRNPTFFGTGEANTFMQILANGNFAGEGQVTSSGNYTVTTTTQLGDGTYTITGRLQDVAGNFSPQTGALQPPLIVDTGVGVPTFRLRPDLVFGGSPPNDVITPFSPQVFEGTAEVGTTVTIKDPNTGTVYDTFQQNGPGNGYTRTLDLVDGRYVLVAEVRDAAGNTAMSGALTLTVSRTALDGDRRFIRALYVSSLARAGTLAEWDAWAPALRLPNGRFLAANSIERSREARTITVKTMYETFLGRAPSGGEEQGWVSILTGGASEEQVIAAILGSNEYFNRSALVAGFAGSSTNSTFIQSLYLQILKRAPSAFEINAWLTVLPTTTRDRVAASFMFSREFRTTNVLSFYRDLLQRPTPPSDPEIAAWVQSNVDLTTIRVLFKASPEFYFRQTGFLP